MPMSCTSVCGSSSQTMRLPARVPFQVTPVHAGSPSRYIVRRAQEEKATDGASTSVSEEEARLEALETAVKNRRRQGAPTAGRKMIIKGQVNQSRDTSNMAPWKEGKLIPEGWEAMSLPQKISELYLGRRGLLFWANKIAFASVFVVVGGWVVFRFVGPALGLYKLAGGDL